MSSFKIILEKVLIQIEIMNHYWKLKKLNILLKIYFLGLLQEKYLKKVRMPKNLS